VFVVFRTPTQATKLPALPSLPLLPAMNPALPHLRHAARRIAERGRVARRLEAAVMLVIVVNVLVLMLDSVADIHRQHGHALSILEWAFTGLFTAEYLLRLWLLRRPWHYARSFFGIVDLLSILPVFLALLLPGLHVLADVRLLRLRLFRILQLPVYLEETRHLRQALARARRKILVFIGVMVLLVMLLGTVIFLVEGPDNGFSSIPVGVYWAAVTMSTTGYGDITPQTGLGRLITGCAILLGYGIIAFPTGIMGAELFAGAMQPPPQPHDSCRCPCHCGKRGTAAEDPK
jgi:voltage-gated potassium channel